jgi:hypothetical protein
MGPLPYEHTFDQCNRVGSGADMTDDEIGDALLGDLARRQIEGARRDPRLGRREGSPTADFFDAVDEVLRFRMTAHFGAHMMADGKVEASGDRDTRQAAWERIEMGRAEIEGAFGWLNATSLVSLHGAVDALVESVGPAERLLRARMKALEIVKGVAEAHPELPELTDDVARSIAEALADAAVEKLRFPKPRFNGLRRWEGALEEVGIGLPAEAVPPPDLDRVLTEACVLRDVLVHRGGRVDAKAAADCATLGFSVGEFVRLDDRRTRELAAALIAYGTDVARRSLARVGLRGPDIDLTRWRHEEPFF